MRISHYVDHENCGYICLDCIKNQKVNVQQIDANGQYLFIPVYDFQERSENTTCEQCLEAIE
jgi:hypothetical protein